MQNVDESTVESFGREWGALTQSNDELDHADRHSVFESYFSIFPWEELPPDAVGADIGCGSGRWAALAAPRAGHLFAIDPSQGAVQTAQANLASVPNVTVLLGEANNLPVDDHSLDFAFCLGVLHHVPDTTGALRAISNKMKSGAPLLLYLYYSLDNRPGWFRAIWRVSNLFRQTISRLPGPLQFGVSYAIAVSIYCPLARAALLLDKMSMLPRAFPLSFYRDKKFYVMRTDAHDRFCTPLEKRFSRSEIKNMLLQSGYRDVRFSEREPYWVSVSYKA